MVDTEQLVDPILKYLTYATVGLIGLSILFVVLLDLLPYIQTITSLLENPYITPELLFNSLGFSFTYILVYVIGAGIIAYLIWKRIYTRLIDEEISFGILIEMLIYAIVLSIFSGLEGYLYTWFVELLVWGVFGIVLWMAILERESVFGLKVNVKSRMNRIKKKKRAVFKF